MTSYRNFHAGEAQLQAESGVDTAEYDRMADEPFRPELNSSEVKFVGGRTFSIAGSLDRDGRPWASALFGPSGELFTVEDLTTITVKPRLVAGDPLFDNVASTGEMGILYFNPSIRRRAKSLGHGTIQPDGTIRYRMHRMFGLCTKYIFRRSHEIAVASGTETAGSPSAARRELSAADRTQLALTDTIFLASHSDQHGTDPTHRGGPPGFVTVIDDATVSIPDYVGNGMFQTLGNLLLDDRIGVLSIDFATGRILQFTGHGSIRASDPDDEFSTRTLVITIDEVRSTTADIGAWTDIEAFDLQPNNGPSGPARHN